MKKLLLIATLLLLCVVVQTEKDYTELVKYLAAKIQEPRFKGSAYDRLAYITDTYGPRMWGSMVLEQVIHEVAGMASKVGFENIRLEQVKNFTKWVRGKESLTLLQPRPFPTKLDVIGLGGSVAGYSFYKVETFRPKF
jgi:carboxypeptidase Q